MISLLNTPAKLLVSAKGILLILALLAVPASAQQEDEVLRINTDLVVLNITVTNRDGKYVPNLRQADFKIYEDGREVEPTQIASFSMQEAPFASVVLLDTSSSMETRLSLARSAAIRFLDNLRTEDVAAVFKFDNKVESVQEFSSGRDLAPMAFSARAKGMTSLNDAIVQGAKALSEREETRRAIVVLSDGADTYSKASSGKALEAALAAGASIYTVDMSATDNSSRSPQSTMALKNFAEKSGGRYLATPGGQALRDAFSSIADELGHQYTIAYRPANRARDGKWRNLEVKVNVAEVNVRSRKGYRAPKG